MKKTKLFASALAFGVIGLTTAGVALAYDKVDTVIGKDGDVKDLVTVDGKIESVDGSHITFSDTQTGDQFTGGVGPSRYSGTYTVGQDVDVKGVIVDGENANNHNFQIIEIDGKVLRDGFEGKPMWSGQGNGTREGSGNGNSASRQGSGQMNGGSFVDANGDGVCDNMK